jgi:hypothetical protein
LGADPNDWANRSRLPLTIHTNFLIAPPTRLGFTGSFILD